MILAKGGAPFIDDSWEIVFLILRFSAFNMRIMLQIWDFTSWKIQYLQSNGKKWRSGWMLICLCADLKGRTGRTERRGHLQPAQSGEIKANKQGTKPDLLGVLSTPAGLRALVQVHFWNTILHWWLNVSFVSRPASQPQRGSLWPHCSSEDMHCVERTKFQQYEWMPTVLLGREVRRYLAGQLWRDVLTSFVFIAQALQLS